MAPKLPLAKRIPRPQSDTLLQNLLSPLGYLYGAAFQLWLSLYEHNLLKPRSLAVPVISIGNITAGGTGKTPFAHYLASYLSNRQRKVGILSRGYGRESREGWALVSDGDRVYGDPKQVGDEPFLLATNLRGIPVVVGRDRFLAGEMAVRKMGCNVLVLDDGFQHLRLRRDLDIVLVDSTNPFGNLRTIPAGILREPLKGLSRADLLVLTRTNQGRNLSELRAFLREINPRVPILDAVHNPLSLSSLQEGESEGIEFARGKRVVALSSLGNPASFERTLEDMGSFLVRRVRFPDHHRYSARDLDWVGRVFRNLGADFIATTEKDGVRLKGLEPPLPIFMLKIRIEVVSGMDSLTELLESRVR